jgi:Flp pilus assembly protein TadB
MYSKTKKPQPGRRKPINWTYVVFVIFGLVMVVGFIITAIM